MLPLKISIKTSVEVIISLFLSIQLTKTTLTWTNKESIKRAKNIICIGDIFLFALVDRRNLGSFFYKFKFG
jgi:hypothetical protein